MLLLLKPAPTALVSAAPESLRAWVMVVLAGGQTVLNPWPIIGGVASATLTAEEFIMPDGALVGDVVVLTKPLGTQACYVG